MTLLYAIDIVGTMVFAISGALTAVEKKLDFFGIAAVGFITALGGGTLRDILIGSTPVGWMNDLSYLYMIIAGLFISILFRKFVQKLRRTFLLFDTIGIAAFTVLGLQKALLIGIHPVIAVMMGMVSAVFGGVIRDIICNEIPLIFRKELYALVCLTGGFIYIGLEAMQIDDTVKVLLTFAFITIVRILVVRYKWKLPDIK